MKVNGLSVAFCLLTALPALGQAPAVPAPAVPELAPVPRTTKTISLRWVAPEIIAHWLAPEKYPAPKDVDIFRAQPDPQLSPYAEIPLPYREQRQRGLVDLPAGLDSLRPDAAQKAIVATGSVAALEEFQQIVAQLDQPLKWIDISATLYKVQSAAIPREMMQQHFVPLQQDDIDGAPRRNGIAVLFDRGEWQRRFDDLVKENKAEKFAFTRRVLNNAASNITWSQQREVPANATPQPSPARLFTTFGLHIVPTLNQDGTMTLLWASSVQSPVITVGSKAALAEPMPWQQQAVNNVAILREGDTILNEIGKSGPDSEYRYFWMFSSRAVKDDAKPAPQ